MEAALRARGAVPAAWPVTDAMSAAAVLERFTRAEKH
jgi:hypothetical protein